MKILNFGHFVFQMVARWIFEIFNRDKCLFCVLNTTLAASIWSRTGEFYYFSCLKFPSFQSIAWPLLV